MQKTINLAPIVFTFAVTAGVLFHDMHIDKAATVAFALPAVLATYGAAHLASGSEHIHVERVSFSNQSNIFHSSLPKVTHRNNEHRYIESKKVATTGGDGLWPSI